MSLDVLLLARAIWSDIDAAYIQNALDLNRRPRDRVDAMSIRFWRNIAPVVRDHESMLAAGHGGALLHAAVLQEYVVASSGPIADLVRAWNAGEGATWRHPAFRVGAVRRNAARRAERAA